MAVHIHPLDLPPRYYKPIGQIVTGWNLTEALISSTIWHAHGIKSPPLGRLFTYQAEAVKKLEMFKLTAEKYTTNPVIQAEMLKLYKVADNLRSKRNNFAHGLWGRMPKEHKTWKIFYLKSTKDTYFLKRETFTLSDLTALAAQIRQFNKDLKKLMREIGAPPP